jgi:hypothetical protein
VIGNVLVQAITAGRFGSLSEARAYVAENVPSEKFFPQTNGDLKSATAQFQEIEAQFIERS